MSATHTHSGLSGIMSNFAYIIIESYGFNPLVFWSVVDGIVEAIEKADASLASGKVFWNKGELSNHRNRRMKAYNANPEEERKMYNHETDRDMMMIRIENEDGTPRGSFSWWPVHPISFNGGSNPLVSSDSMGFAALLFDYSMNNGSRAGTGDFVSAFGSSNLGDVSPSINGRDDDSNLFGAEECKQMGTLIFNRANEIFHDMDNMQQLTGAVKHGQRFFKMTNVTVRNL